MSGDDLMFLRGVFFGAGAALVAGFVVAVVALARYLRF